MSNDLEIYNDILFLHLRPWKISFSGQKFRQLLYSLSKENYNHQPLYEINFPKPLTDKTKYYQILMDNGVKIVLNNIHTEINIALTENAKKYIIHTFLTKKLVDKLNDTEKAICTHQYYLKIVEENQNKELKDNIWIIQYLKYQLIRLYLEIQNAYPQYLNEDALTEEQLHSKYFSEPFHNLTIPAPDLKLAKPTYRNTSPSISEEFIPVKGDLRSKRGILSYEQVIRNADVFLVFERGLYNEELIDKNYYFSNKYSEKQKLAAIYCWLIQKRYFIKKDFKKRKDIRETDIRKFLDHRYNADLDQQFRTWLRDPEKLRIYLEDLTWLDEIPLP